MEKGLFIILKHLNILCFQKQVFVNEEHIYRLLSFIDAYM